MTPDHMKPRRDAGDRRRPVMAVTGASRGIGAATARLAAESGFDVIVGYLRDDTAANDVVQACRSRGAEAQAVQVDLGSEASIVSFFDATIDRFKRLDSFVNNAGIVAAATTVANMEANRIEAMFRVNAIGAIIAAREAIRRMAPDRGGVGGTIVNVSSAASYTGSPNEYVDYAATKGAIDTLTIGLAKEVADQGIRVNAVRPGLIYTDIHQTSGIENRVDKLSVNLPMKRGGQPAEVASAIMWLATDASSFVTGSFIDVAGGL